MFQMKYVFCVCNCTCNIVRHHYNAYAVFFIKFYFIVNNQNIICLLRFVHNKRIVIINVTDKIIDIFQISVV